MCALLSFSNQRFLLFHQILKGHHHHCIRFLCCVTNHHKQWLRTAHLYDLIVALGPALFSQVPCPGSHQAANKCRWLQLCGIWVLFQAHTVVAGIQILVVEGQRSLFSCQRSGGVHSQLLKTPIIPATRSPHRPSQSWQLTSGPPRALLFQSVMTQSYRMQRNPRNDYSLPLPYFIRRST